MTVTIRMTTACLMTTLFLAGCQTSTVAVKSGTPTAVSAMALYQQHACTSWEPPQGKVISPAANGTTAVIANKYTIDVEGHPCKGKVIDRTLVTYTSRAGFKGQDRFVIQYDYINNDGGGRASRSEEVNVNVQ